MAFGPTHKKKNTYIVKVNNLMADTSVFELCKYTPLPVTVLNGKDVQKPHNIWMGATKFPNPGAVCMQSEFKTIAPVMGPKIASTVIEYLDKANNRPVLTLFPTSAYVHDGYENDYMSHLNHASRRDLAHQIKIREQMMNQILSDRQK